MTDDLHAALLPSVTAAGLELVDVHLRSGVLQVTVDRDGGVDLEALTDANRAVSAVLDELDPIPGRYSLEVSSPGVERSLRTPVHFAKAIGESVSVKTRPQVPGERRVRGTLVSSDDDGFTLTVEGAGEGAEPMRLAYRDIDSARTVFVWGASEGRRGGGSSRATKATTKATTTKKSNKDNTGPVRTAPTTNRATQHTPQHARQERKQVGTP